MGQGCVVVYVQGFNTLLFLVYIGRNIFSGKPGSVAHKLSSSPSHDPIMTKKLS